MRNALYLVAAVLLSAGQAAPQSDPAYASGRRSLCQGAAPEGEPLAARRSDGGVHRTGLVAERTWTFVARADAAKAGELDLCSEYGRIEVTDSDDGQIHLQVRTSAIGDGNVQALEDTPVVVRLVVRERILRVAVWHAQQGFTLGANPCIVSIRVQLPPSIQYRLIGVANHGGVVVRNLTLSGGRIHGLVGLKTRGIPGYHGGHELDRVRLAGDVELTLAGGVRGSGSVAASVAAIAPARLTITTDDADVRVAVTPDPEVGIAAIARSGTGTLRVVVDRPGVIPQPGSAAAQPRPQSGGEIRLRSEDYDLAAKHLQIQVVTATGNVQIVSVM